MTSAAPQGQTLARYLATRVPTLEGAAVDESAGAVRRRLNGGHFEAASHLFLLDGDRHLTGVVSMTQLLAAPDDVSVASLASLDLPVLTADTDRETAASLAIRHDVECLPICSREGVFLGAVHARSLLGILRDEHLEDLHHMAGILGKSEAARAALTSSPWERARFRLPWVLIGFAGSALATVVMSRFEATLSQQIAVAFFVPAIVYLADAVGTQSEAVAVRGLSLGSMGLGPLLLRELWTGMLIGLALSLLAWPMAWAFTGDARLSAAVALSLFVACSVATSIGLLLPWAFERLGFDPAHGSGPLATVLQDVLSLLVYFGVVAAVLGA